MTTPDAGQRLIEDLRIFASMECCPEIHHKTVLKAADEIERLRGVEAEYQVLLSELGLAYVHLLQGDDSIVMYMARKAKIDFSIDGEPRVVAAIAASRSTGAADVEEDHG